MLIFGYMWQLVEAKRQHEELEDVCLGLALFKLLRRRFEGCPTPEDGMEQARDLVFRGLLRLDGASETEDAERAFEVVELEMNFLMEYYQAVIPVALPKPALFIANFAFSMAFILVYCIVVLLVTGNGDIFHVLASLFRGLVGLSIDMVVQYRCFRHQVSFLVIQGALWMKNRTRPRIRVHQVEMLKLHPRKIWMLLSHLLKRRLVGLPRAVVTTEAKLAIVRCLKASGEDHHFVFGYGEQSLHRSGFGHLAWACSPANCESTTELILVWHLATSLFETRERPELPPDGEAAGGTAQRRDGHDEGLQAGEAAGGTGDDGGGRREHVEGAARLLGGAARVHCACAVDRGGGAHASAGTRVGHAHARRRPPQRQRAP